MRQLKTSDLFSAMRVVKAAGIKDEIKRIALENESKKDVNVREVGAELVLSIVEGLAEKNAEEKFYEFLAGPLEMPAGEIQDLPFTALIEKFKELSSMMAPEGWTNFFKSLAAMIK